MAAFKSFFPNRPPHQTSTVPSAMDSPFPFARAPQTLNFQKVICKIIDNIAKMEQHKTLSVEMIFRFSHFGTLPTLDNARILKALFFFVMFQMFYLF